MSTKSNTSETDPSSYKNLVDLMALFAEATGRLGELEATIQEAFLKLVDEHREEFARFQQVAASSEASIEDLALLHPEWFKKAKTLKTPYGSVGFRKTSKLVVKNEEVTILLIQQAGEEAKGKYIRTFEALDLEALEKLDDADLKKFRIVREESQSCSVKAAKIDLGKAVAESADKDKAA
jgi:hypothetical protein